MTPNVMGASQRPSEQIGGMKTPDEDQFRKKISLACVARKKDLLQVKSGTEERTWKNSQEQKPEHRN